MFIFLKTLHNPTPNCPYLYLPHKFTYIWLFDLGRIKRAHSCMSSQQHLNIPPSCFPWITFLIYSHLLWEQWKYIISTFLLWIWDPHPWINSRGVCKVSNSHVYGGVDGESRVFLSGKLRSANIEHITSHTINCETRWLFMYDGSVWPGHLATG